jgi:hypothetical protein
MTLFAYLDTLTKITGSNVIAAAKRQAGPVQDRLGGDLDNVIRWDALAGKCHGGTAGRLRYSALSNLTAYAMDGAIDRQAVRCVVLLATLDRLGFAWQNDTADVPVSEIVAADNAADATFVA